MTVYRSTSVMSELDAARRALREHWTDPAAGLCVECGRSGPCPAANDSAAFLAERSALMPRTKQSTVDVVSPRLLTAGWLRWFAGHR
jgi:hypothetical protein